MMNVTNVFKHLCVNSNRVLSNVSCLKTSYVRNAVPCRLYRSLAGQSVQRENERGTSGRPCSTLFILTANQTRVSCVKFGNRCYSSDSKNNKHKVTLDNIFDSVNKERVIKHLLSVKPIERPVKVNLHPRKAAVLVPLCLVNGEPSLLFMMRSIHLTNHAGEMCFPGGMQDETDKTLIETALRETEEEIGLDKSKVQIWGPAAPLPSRQGHLVTPVIGYCGEVDVTKLTLNLSEVDSVFTRPLSTFLNSENQRYTQFRYQDQRGYSLPVFTGGEHSIWGLTAIITHQVLAIIAPELYTFKLKHRR